LLTGNAPGNNSAMATAFGLRDDATIARPQPFWRSGLSRRRTSARRTDCLSFWSFGNLFVARSSSAGVVQHRERFLRFADFQEDIGKVAHKVASSLSIDRAPHCANASSLRPSLNNTSETVNIGAFLDRASLLSGSGRALPANDPFQPTCTEIIASAVIRRVELQALVESEPPCHNHTRSHAAAYEK